MKSDLRKLAEAKAAQSPDIPKSLSPDEIRATLHELQVHQIELEMQNEELRRAQTEIEAGRARYFDLYDLAPVGYITLSEPGLILEANLTAATLLGTARSKLVKQPISHFIVKDDQDVYYLHRKQLFESGKPQECELRLVKPDGARFWAYLTATAAQAEDGSPVCRVALSDISERRRAEVKTQHLAQVLLAIRNVNHLIVHEVYPQRLIAQACANLTKTLGYNNAWIALLADDGRTVAATADAGFAGQFEDMRQRLARGAFPACMIQALGRNATVLVHDPSVSCADCSLAREYSGRTGFTRRLAFAGKIYGILAVSVPTWLAHDSEEQSLFDEVADDLGFALHKIDLQAQLDQNEERLRLALKATNDVVWDWDIVNDAQRWNESGTAVFGWTDIVAAPQTSAWWVDRIHPEDRSRVDQTFFAAVRNPAADRWHDEYRFRKTDGTYAYVVDRGHILRDAGGQAVRMVGAMLDISKRRQTEAELVFQAHLLQNIRELVVATDLQGRITYISESTCAMLGRSYDELMGAHVSVLGDDATRGASQEEIVYRTREDGHWRGEVANIAADGRTYLLECRTWLIHDVTGAPCGMVGISVDITERKQAEEALRASEMRFKELLLKVPTVAVQGYALDGTVRYWNRASETFYGYTAEEALNRNLLDLIIPSAMRDGVRAAIRQMVETGETLPASELELMRKDGSLIPVYSSHALVQLPGQMPELFCVDIDLTERKHAEAEREKLQAEFLQAQKMESVGRLAGGVAHDFNNLLMGIMGYAELCREELAPDHRIQTWLAEIIAESNRSADLVRQLLAFARKQIVQPKALDLNEQIGGMLKMLRRLIGERIELAWSPAASPRIVNVDPSHIDQVMANLCVNAADAITGHGQIAIATRNVIMDETACLGLPEMKPGSYVLVTVADTGCGMDTDTLAHAFEPFFTTKGVGRGTGLGLATVYGIVKQSNGFIQVDSVPGAGSTFSIYLPALACSESAAAPLADVEPPPGGSETILVVDDERSIRVTAAAHLERLGYTVLLADGPETALRLARAHVGAIHLLLSDMIMPGMSGVELRSRLLTERPNVKTILITGYAAADFFEPEERGTDTVRLTKPVSFQDLALAIRSALGDQHAETT